MTAGISQILEQALVLPEHSRAELAESLLESIPPPSEFVSEQMAVVARRMASVEKGRTHLVPAEEAHRRVREALAKRGQ